MRTTLTLDPDLADKLKEEARRQGISFKEVVNSNLRRGLAASDAPPSRYKLKPRPMRPKPGLDLDRARDLADRLEDEEVLRKTSVGK
jgi:Ribbon-helix-helix protein, copG family